MSKTPSLNYDRVVHALRRAGWTVVRQRGSHIRMQKMDMDGTLKITIPAHSPIKRSTLSHILKQAKISLDDFLRLV